MLAYLQIVFSLYLPRAHDLRYVWAEICRTETVGSAPGLHLPPPEGANELVHLLLPGTGDNAAVYYRVALHIGFIGRWPVYIPLYIVL